jgi:hypothetical protein
MEMAREAGAVFPADGSYHQFERHEDLEAFAALVREDEREACAKIADTEASKWGGFDSGFEASIDIADAIRARGQT